MFLLFPRKRTLPFNVFIFKYSTLLIFLRVSYNVFWLYSPPKNLSVFIPRPPPYPHQLHAIDLKKITHWVQFVPLVNSWVCAIRQCSSAVLSGKFCFPPVFTTSDSQPPTPSLLWGSLGLGTAWGRWNGICVCVWALSTDVGSQCFHHSGSWVNHVGCTKGFLWGGLSGVCLRAHSYKLKSTIWYCVHWAECQ